MSRMKRKDIMAIVNEYAPEWTWQDLQKAIARHNDGRCSGGCILPVDGWDDIAILRYKAELLTRHIRCPKGKAKCTKKFSGHPINIDPSSREKWDCVTVFGAHENRLNGGLSGVI